MNKSIRPVSAAIIFLFAVFTTAQGQKIPKLNPISEKQLEESLSPAEKKGKWGFANEDGKFRVKPVFDETLAYKEVSDDILLAKVRFADKWGLLKRDGTYLVEPRYDEIKDFNQGVAIFRDGSDYGFLNAEGIVLAAQLQQIECFNPNGQAWYQADNLWGVINADGTILFPNIYSCKAMPLAKSLLKTTAGNKFGVISLDLKRVIKEPTCESVELDAKCKNLILFKEHGALGCLSADGAILSGPQYEEIQSLSEMTFDRIMVKKAGKYGLINGKGQQVIPPVMKTNQFSLPRSIYQVMEDTGNGYSEPYVYYKDKKYSIDDYDSQVLKRLNPKQYAQDDPAFPLWMKNHLGEEEKQLIWYSYHKFSPSLPDSTFLAYSFDEADENAIVVKKDMKIYDADGFDYADNNYLSTATFSVGSMDIPFGKLLTTLFKSVDANKISAYDRAHGTSILYNWEYIAFAVPSYKILPDGRLLVCLGMCIDDRLMQIIIACLNQKGDVLYTIKENGDLYCQNKTLEGVELKLLGDLLILSTAYNVDSNYVEASTSIYRNSKRLLVLDNFIPLVSCNDHNRLLFTGYAADCAILYLISSDGKNKQEIYLNDDHIEETPIPTILNESILLYSKDSGLLMGTIDRINREIYTPALRYVMSEWDGEKIIALSKNSWKDLDDATWEYIPRNTKNESVFHLDNVMVRVFPVNQFGTSVYGVKFEDDPDEYYRYGLIGFDDYLFTMPVFEDVKWISSDTVRIKEGDTWKEAKLSDLVCYSDIQAQQPNDCYYWSDDSSINTVSIKLLDLFTPSNSAPQNDDNALWLYIHPEYFQYNEITSCKHRDTEGGGEEVIITYSYEPTWVSYPINSSSFSDPEYKNANKYRPCYFQDLDSKSVKIYLDRQQVSDLTKVKVILDQRILEELNAKVKAFYNDSQNDYVTISNNVIYIGRNASPEVGDMRITYTLRE